MTMVMRLLGVSFWVHFKGKCMDNYEKWYIEAIIASNEAGYACMSAADVIKNQDEHIKDLIERLNEVHSWIVCAGIAPPEDMMQNAERIEKVTNLKGLNE